MLAFRLRPPLRSFPSRAYSSPSFLKNPPFARPYLWWTKARYRPDGSRRSILRGILHGVFYVSVTVYAFRHYRMTKLTKVYLKRLSNVVELQRINHKYRGSTFTEPAEIKAYVIEMAKTDIIPGLSAVIPAFCEHYEALSQDLPEYREQLRKSICELSEHLANPHAVERRGGTVESWMVGVAMDVEIACQKVMITVLIILAKKNREELQGIFNKLTRK